MMWGNYDAAVPLLQRKRRRKLRLPRVGFSIVYYAFLKFSHMGGKHECRIVENAMLKLSPFHTEA